MSKLGYGTIVKSAIYSTSGTKLLSYIANFQIL